MATRGTVAGWEARVEAVPGRRSPGPASPPCRGASRPCRAGHDYTSFGGDLTRSRASIAKKCLLEHCCLPQGRLGPASNSNWRSCHRTVMLMKISFSAAASGMGFSWHGAHSTARQQNAAMYSMLQFNVRHSLYRLPFEQAVVI